MPVVKETLLCPLVMENGHPKMAALAEPRGARPPQGANVAHPKHVLSPKWHKPPSLPQPCSRSTVAHARLGLCLH